MDAENTTTNNNQRLAMSRYKGESSKVKIKAWVAVFESTFTDKNDQEKIRLLGQYLEDEALTWFAEEILTPRVQQWVAAKKILEDRFDATHVRPIVAAKDRFLNKDESINDYYNEKMRLLRQTGLIDLDIVALLTEGLPQYYRTPLISGSPSLPTSWLSLALQLEKSFKRNQVARFTGQMRPNGSYPSFGNAQQPQQVHHVAENKGNKKSERKPPQPCKICKRRENKEAWHWHSECPNKENADPRHGSHSGSQQATASVQAFEEA